MHYAVSDSLQYPQPLRFSCEDTRVTRTSFGETKAAVSPFLSPTGDSAELYSESRLLNLQAEGSKEKADKCSWREWLRHLEVVEDLNRRAELEACNLKPRILCSGELLLSELVTLINHLK